MSQKPTATPSEPTHTIKVPVKNVEVHFTGGQSEFWRVIEAPNFDRDEDSLKGNDLALQITLQARPEAPALVRPLKQVITIYRVNVLYFTVIESMDEIEVLDRVLESQRFKSPLIQP